MTEDQDSSGVNDRQRVWSVLLFSLIAAALALAVPLLAAAFGSPLADARTLDNALQASPYAIAIISIVAIVWIIAGHRAVNRAIALTGIIVLGTIGASAHLGFLLEGNRQTQASSAPSEPTVRPGPPDILELAQAAELLVLDSTTGTYRRPVSLQPDAPYVLFRITIGSETTLVVDAHSDTVNATDLVLGLFRATSGGALEPIAQNDDGGVRPNGARVAAPVEKGNYVVVVQNIMPQQVLVNFNLQIWSMEYRFLQAGAVNLPVGMKVDGAFDRKDNLPRRIFSIRVFTLEFDPADAGDDKCLVVRVVPEADDGLDPRAQLSRADQTRPIGGNDDTPLRMNSRRERLGSLLAFRPVPPPVPYYVVVLADGPQGGGKFSIRTEWKRIAQGDECNIAGLGPLSQ